MLTDLYSEPSTGLFLAQILLFALALDSALGDPRWLYSVVPHPVVVIGQLIDRLEKRLNRPHLSRASKLTKGMLLTLGIIGLSAFCGAVILVLADWLPGGSVLEVLAVSSLLAFRGLYDEVKRVATFLGRSLADGRWAVSKIVGRDPESLDEAGVARAAVESLAENFSDGVVAPLFWYCLLGLPGLCAYKAINTLDSMIGHKNPRYEAFGKFAARLDDLANLVPARLAGLFFVVAAALHPAADHRRAWQIMLRDARKHNSPNAGWQEAAVAGALDFALAGPRRYGSTVVEDHWMGNGRSRLNGKDIGNALSLYILAGLLAAVTAVTILTLLGICSRT
ncbi:adenosylcobinamide-phosphate synthase CbiB [Pelagibius sp. Alg239-R121]|uniref:adenosylcobinamide-phosphate synthase CbiB n=1 Tax=Pelagibius sp. Alg239-R121 TaxID=2993448 RepID=UPI0024A622D3|nr:adenosylcobinamide-phosphate synthase CbiB [Pelagibius sp. Alg239-R121]